MQILYELVTVIREQNPGNHWETGKMETVKIYKPGYLPGCCTKTFFQTTSNWLYVLLAKHIGRLSALVCPAGLRCVRMRILYRSYHDGKGFFYIKRNYTLEHTHLPALHFDIFPVLRNCRKITCPFCLSLSPKAQCI